MKYARPTDHSSMLFDGQRNSAYARAMAKLIGSDTTVMDLGAGLGVHGFNAARLGAAAVHLVEPAAVLSVAEQIARENDLKNVYCHQCAVEDLTLAAPVDVIVSVFTGNFLLMEDLLPTLFFARDRFLAPGGHLIPDRGRMEVMPVSAPDYYRDHVEQWGAYPEHTSKHGLPALDYGAVRNFAANSLYCDNRDAFKTIPLGTPSTLTELDFNVADSASCDSEIQVLIERDGICHGWLGGFQMRLVDEWFSTWGEPVASHWSPVFLPLERPLTVRAGEQIGFALKRPEFGDWTWTTRYGGSSQRQSTFLSQPVLPEQLSKLSDQYQPLLNRRGEAAAWALQRMAGELSLARLANELVDVFPAVFRSQGEALEFATDLARRFG